MFSRFLSTFVIYPLVCGLVTIENFFLAIARRRNRPRYAVDPFNIDFDAGYSDLTPFVAKPCEECGGERYVASDAFNHLPCTRCNPTR